MAEGDKHRAASRQSPAVDLLVIGGGVMGLWAAHHAVRAGLSVHLVDAGRIGSGASGGLPGALMPHMPDRWNGKKQFQFEALVSLEEEINALEAATGLSTGYRRSGRLIPLPKPHLSEIALGHREDARANWTAGERQFHWNVHGAGFAAGLLAEDVAPFGLVEDTLAARVSPRGLTAVLKAALAASPCVKLSEGVSVLRLDHGQAILQDGAGIAFGNAVIANGHRSRDLIEAIAGPLGKPVVVPVKGQAGLLTADLDPATPVVYLDGLYIVPHEGGRVAIGSTSENRFDEPCTTDGQLEDLIAKARAVMPALREAEVVERWAGLRPKAIGRDPMVGHLPGQAAVSVLTGGFKVSFGIAHRLSAALVEAIAADLDVTGLPESFSPLSHLKEAGFTAR